MRQLVFYGRGNMGRPIHSRLSAQFDTFRGTSQADHRLLRDPDGRPCELASLARPVAVVCVPPLAAPQLIAELLQSLDTGSTVIDLGNTDPLDTDRLAHAALDRGLSYLGIGVATGSDLATERCCLTVGEARGGLGAEIDDVLGAIAGRGGRYAMVGPPVAGHMAKVLFNPAGYVCTYAVAGACSHLLKHGMDPAGTAEVVRSWCEDGSDSYLARVAIDCLEDDRFAQIVGAFADLHVSRSGVAAQWMRLMAECESLPPVTAAAVSTRIGHVPPFATSDSRSTPDSVIVAARRIYEDIYSVGIRELVESVTQVAHSYGLPFFKRCTDVWETSSLLSGSLYTRVASPGGRLSETADAAVLAGALAAQRPLVALMRERFGGHALVTSGGSDATKAS